MKVILYEPRAAREIHAFIAEQAQIIGKARALCGAPLRNTWRVVTPKERSGQGACAKCADAFVRLHGGRDASAKTLRDLARDAGFFPTAIQPALDRIDTRRREVRA